jgi:uncharacterized protein
LKWEKEKVNQREILQILKNYRQSQQADGKLRRIGIFGSVARGQAGPDSDLDIVIDCDTADIFMMVKIKNDLEKLFSVKVDLIRYRERMNSFLKERINKEAIFV